VSIIGVLAVIGGGALFYINSQENLGATDSSAHEDCDEIPGSHQCGNTCCEDDPAPPALDPCADCGKYQKCVNNEACVDIPPCDPGGKDVNSCGKCGNADCPLPPGSCGPGTGKKCCTDNHDNWTCPGNRCCGPNDGDCPICGGSVCGNSKKEPNEECDDGNKTNGDGCSSTCKIEVPNIVCGNNKKEVGEECDDGNKTNGDGCSSICKIETVLAESVCGNNIIEEGEECDGNTCEFGSCTVDCTCPGNPAKADFGIIKRDSVVKSSDGLYSTIVYTILLVNNGGASGTISRVVDTIDSNMNSGWFISNSVSPSTGFAKTNNVLTWTLSGDLAEFTPGEQVNFQYSFKVPISNTGSYTNSVTAYVSTAGVSNVSATNVAYVGSEVPNGGLFDSFTSRVLTGTALVLFAGVAFYSDRVDTSLVNVFGYGARLKIRKNKIEKKKNRFEKKIK